MNDRTPDLPPAAVDAAAKASYEFAWRLRPVKVHWDDTEEYIRDEYRADARAALAAAWPVLRAQIADEIAQMELLYIRLGEMGPDGGPSYCPLAPLQVRDAAESIARGGAE